MGLTGVGSGGSSGPYLIGGAGSQRPPASFRAGGTAGFSGDAFTLSGAGRVLSQLQALRASDPKQFKAVLSKAAADLQAAARQAGATPRARHLADLAKQYQAAAETGDLSRIKPAGAADRVAQAYGTGQPDGLGELARLLAQGGPPGGVQSPPGIDPRYVLKSTLRNLSRVA